MPHKQKIIFAPVSSPQGIGEYMRSLIIAQAIIRKWPQIEVQFIINRKAPYADTVPFPVHLINQSPTKEIAAVNAIVSNENPDLIIFDCSGRAAQFRHAANMGVKVVFISQHKRKRRKGFSLRRIPYVTQHWIAQLQFVDGGLNFIERIKQKLLGVKPPIFIGPVYDGSRLDQKPVVDLPADYILYSSGGGGYEIKGEKATELFSRVAADVFSRTGLAGVVILGMNYQGEPTEFEGVKYVRQLENADLMNVLNHAVIGVLSGGDLMSQAMTINKPVVAVPVAKDQPARIKAFADNDLVVTSEANYTDMSEKIAQLAQDKNEMESLRTRVSSADIHNGVDLAVCAIGDLFEK